MLLLADSGSSKTDWALVDGDSVIHFRTAGLHPAYSSTEKLRALMNDAWPAGYTMEDIRELFFYGSGCLRDPGRIRMENILRPLFPVTKIKVLSDLEGCALSTLGNEAGTAAILGTGSSVAKWSGHEVTRVSPSLGYLLGDEGSAADIGKQLARDVLYGNCPTGIMKLVLEYIGGSKENLLNSIQGSSHPGRFLGSLLEPLFPQSHDPYVIELVNNRFNAFIQAHLLADKPDEKIGLNGSIAHHFKEILIPMLRDEGYEHIIIVRHPMEKLIGIHQRAW